MSRLPLTGCPGRTRLEGPRCRRRVDNACLGWACATWHGLLPVRRVPPRHDAEPSLRVPSRMPRWSCAHRTQGPAELRNQPGSEPLPHDRFVLVAALRCSAPEACSSPRLRRPGRRTQSRPLARLSEPTSAPAVPSAAAAAWARTIIEVQVAAGCVVHHRIVAGIWRARRTAAVRPEPHGERRQERNWRTIRQIEVFPNDVACDRVPVGGIGGVGLIGGVVDESIVGRAYVRRHGTQAVRGAPLAPGVALCSRQRRRRGAHDTCRAPP